MFPLEDLKRLASRSAWDVRSADFDTNIDAVEKSIVYTGAADLEAWSSAVAEVCNAFSTVEMVLIGPRDDAMKLALLFARKLQRAWELARGAPMAATPTHPVIDFLRKLRDWVLVRCMSSECTLPLFETGIKGLTSLPSKAVAAQRPPCMQMYVQYMRDVVTGHNIMLSGTSITPIFVLSLAATFSLDSSETAKDTDLAVFTDTVLAYAKRYLHLWTEKVQCLNVLLPVLVRRKTRVRTDVVFDMLKPPRCGKPMHADIVHVIGEYVHNGILQEPSEEADPACIEVLKQALMSCVPEPGQCKTQWVHAAQWLLTFGDGGDSRIRSMYFQFIQEQECCLGPL
jgi:hypothetical protein